MSDNQSSKLYQASFGAKLWAVLRSAYKEKPFRFYGRMSRSDFWTFLLSSYVLLALCCLLYFVPYIGDLLIAIGVIYIFITQLSASVRRLHDINLRGLLVALPYILLLIYFVMMIPVYAMYHEHADFIMNVAKFVTALSYLALLALCLKRGTVGQNRFGTDPLDESIEQQDYINPEHLDVPEYVGDPWRKFKNKHQTSIESKSHADNTDANENLATTHPNKPNSHEEPQDRTKDHDHSNEFKDVFNKDLREMMDKDFDEVAKKINDSKMP